MGKDYFFYERNKFFWIDHIDEIVKYVKEHFKDEIKETIKVADEVVDNKFLFNLRWDMERTKEVVEFKDEINWVYMPEDDEEWIYQLNRHRYWICLGQAYVLTRNEKYSKTFIEQLTHWICNVKKDNPKYNLAWRTLEAGIRLENWIKAITYFKDSPYLTDEVYDLFKSSIVEHAEYLMSADNTFMLVSNWGVQQNHGLLLAGIMLPESNRTREYIKTALERLTDEIDIQVYKDGVQWEQATMYHNEVVLCYLDTKIIAEKNNIHMPEIINRKLLKMCYATMYNMKPDFYELSMGDSDEIDPRDILTKAAYLYNDGYLKNYAYEKIDFDSIWDLGIKSVKEYENLTKVNKNENAISLNESGNYYFFGNSKEEKNYFHFYAGAFGSGHTHFDKLHIDLFANGEDILIDAGRYTYVDKKERYELKGGRAHNTIIVDDEEFIKASNPWYCSKLARSINQKMITGEKYDYVEGGNLGYYDLKNGSVYINRRIIYIKPDIYVIVDELYGNGEHKYNEYFHFNCIGNVYKENDLSLVYESQKNYTEMKFINDDIHLQIIESKYSKHYNEIDENKAAEVTLFKNGFASIITVISNNDKSKIDKLSIEKCPVYLNHRKVLLEDKMAEAIKIKKGKRKYTLVIGHEDYACPTDAFNVDGCIGLGQVVIFDRTNNKNEREIIV